MGRSCHNGFRGRCKELGDAGVCGSEKAPKGPKGCWLCQGATCYSKHNLSGVLLYRVVITCQSGQFFKIAADS